VAMIIFSPSGLLPLLRKPGRKDHA
jgi:hypothetical protein